MKNITDKEKARAFDMLMSGKMNPEWKVYNELRQSDQENWSGIIIRQACENALQLILSTNETKGQKITCNVISYNR
jgi:hypothetical protein